MNSPYRPTQAGFAQKVIQLNSVLSMRRAGTPKEFVNFSPGFPTLGQDIVCPHCLTPKELANPGDEAAD